MQSTHDVSNREAGPEWHRRQIFSLFGLEDHQHHCRMHRAAHEKPTDPDLRIIIYQLL